MKGMPVGNSDFRELRDLDRYFVDKSMFIDEILESTAKVTLITRPRRFGKTLNLSMTDAYLNIDYAEEPDRFKGLKISEARPNDPEKNSNHIIVMSFKRLKTKDYSGFVVSFKEMMRDVYRKFPDLKNSEKLDEVLTERYETIIGGTDDYEALTMAVMHLCEMIEKHHGKKPIILIDEYDNPMNNAFGDDELLEQIVGFLRDVLSNALKDNGPMRFAVLTGVMKISQESIFSGLNNPKVIDIFSTKYDEMFGFSQEEVEWLLEANGYESKVDEAKEWYDGYRFGKEDVYNPWSIINFIDNGCKADKYWAGTSGNTIIEELLTKAEKSTYESLMELAEGKDHLCAIDPSVTYDEMSMGGENIFTVLVLSGYLNAVPDGRLYNVSIPNLEMRYVFSSKIMKHLAPTCGNTQCEIFIEAAKSGNSDVMTNSLNRIFDESTSLRILTHEHVYQAFITGMLLQFGSEYRIETDRESGDGYFDIRLLAKTPAVDSIIIEIKRTRAGVKDATMEKHAAKALNQIVEKRYAESIGGRVLSYGMVFSGKRALVRYRELER